MGACVFDAYEYWPLNGLHYIVVSRLGAIFRRSEL